MYEKVNMENETRNHSSKMRTVRCSSRRRKGVSAWGCLSEGVSAQGCLPRGCLCRGCLPMVVSARGMSAQGDVCPGWCLPRGSLCRTSHYPACPLPCRWKHNLGKLCLRAVTIISCLFWKNLYIHRNLSGNS